MRLIEYLHEFNASRELDENADLLNNESSGLKSYQLVELIFGVRWQRFFWIKQIKSEITKLCQLVSERNPSVILEIGTANGGSLFLFTKLASKNALIISLDLPRGKFGGGYPQYRVKFYKRFSGPNQRMHFLRADSHDKSTVELVKEILNGRKIDFLFIDGDHSYEGVKQDFEQYSKLTSHDAIIALHDVARHKPESECKVDEFWNEVKLKYNRFVEFIENDNQLWAGIGVLHQSDKKL